MKAHKKLRDKGVLALGGRHLIGRHNNQIGVGGRGGRDSGEEARGGESVWGERYRIDSGNDSNDEK